MEAANQMPFSEKVRELIGEVDGTEKEAAKARVSVW